VTTSRAELERTARQSVLDRLIDAEPGLAGDPAVTWAESVRQLKASLRRDLEWLLNTRRHPSLDEIPEQYRELRRSLYTYGLADVTQLDPNSPAHRQRLLRDVEHTIATFEPRLAGVHVSLVDAPAESRRQLRFLIKGVLRVDPNPEHVVFDTVLEIASGEYQVKGGGGA
jgi:type VI secretion system protein ImpF